jgi:hypothetical protein
VLDENLLISAVEVQKRSYNLLRWVSDAIPRGFIRLERAHEYSTDADAAVAWISEHFENLPPHCRPTNRTEQELRRFANFFASYLLTSFELQDDPGTQLVSECGCYCPICTYIAAAPHLQAKKLRRSDKRRAENLKLAYLEDLTREVGINLARDDACEILGHQTASRNAALATYGRELIRRCNGLSEGPAVLALWRQFAWKATGSPIPGFELQAPAILDAERYLVDAIARTTL